MKVGVTANTTDSSGDTGGPHRDPQMSQQVRELCPRPLQQQLHLHGMQQPQQRQAHAGAETMPKDLLLGGIKSKIL